MTESQMSTVEGHILSSTYWKAIPSLSILLLSRVLASRLSEYSTNFHIWHTDPCSDSQLRDEDETRLLIRLEGFVTIRYKGCLKDAVLRIFTARVWHPRLPKNRLKKARQCIWPIISRLQGRKTGNNFCQNDSFKLTESSRGDWTVRVGCWLETGILKCPVFQVFRQLDRNGTSCDGGHVAAGGWSMRHWRPSYSEDSKYSSATSDKTAVFEFPIRLSGSACGQFHGPRPRYCPAEPVSAGRSGRTKSTCRPIRVGHSNVG